MLARAQTSNAMTWAGRLGVLGLAALLSSTAPVQAQVGDFDPPQKQARLEEPDRPEHSTRDDHRDAAERLEEHLKDLAERLGKDVGPFGEEIRKAIEQAAGTVNEALKKDDITSDDFREALERAGEELRRSFRSGGPVDREAREAWEKAQEELRESLDRAREDARAALRDHAGDLDRDPFAGGEGREGAAGDDLSKARNQVRDLQRQLRAAMRNLEQHERRESEARRAPRRGPDANRNRPRPPAPPVPPSPPSEPEEPAARRFFRGGPGGGAGTNPRVDRRLNDLESKMDRLLEELKDLKKDKSKDKAKDKDDEEKEDRVSL